jgi:hypothetical protein
LLRFSTRSPLEGVRREIQRRKFEATLKPRIDAEVELWHESQPPAMPPPEIDDLHIKSPWNVPPPTQIDDLHIKAPWNVPPPIQIDDLHIKSPWNDQQQSDQP